MAVTYGFYNSINKDRMYNAIQMSQIFDGVINDGVYMSVLSHFAVRAGSGMSVVVGGGRAWFDHTWTYNDSDMILNIDESEFEAGRIDAITIKIDRRESGRVNTVEVVKGTPSDHPVKPELPDSENVYYHPLAYVTVNAGVTEITDANIENCVGVNERTPFVTGIIETINAEELIGQWQAEWDEWNAEHRQAYLDWVDQQETDMENWTAGQKEAFLEWMASEKADFESWEATQKAIFDDWFANLHYILDGDVAAHLQLEIEGVQGDIENLETSVTQELSDLHTEIDGELNTISENVFKHYYDLCNRNTTYTRNKYGEIDGWTSQDDGGGISLTVTISNDDSVETVVCAINDGTYIWTKTSVMDYSSYELTETYTKEDIA